MPDPVLALRRALPFCLGWMLGACGSWSEPGVQLEFVSKSRVTPGESVPSGLGIVRVEELWWTSVEIEIERCEPLLGVWTRWLIPEAHAHGASSPTRLAVPAIVSATGDQSSPLGQLTPPAGRYCSVRYRIGPADADAVGLLAAPQMRDHSLRLRAEFGAAPERLQAIELASRRSFDVTRPIELELSAEHPRASLELELDPERWLGGVDLGAVTGAARDELLVELFGAALEVRAQ